MRVSGEYCYGVEARRGITASGRIVHMRRLSVVVIAGLLLVGLVAAPAAADRNIENGNIPHYSFVYAFGIFVEQPEVRELPTGDWAEFGGGWGTATEELRQQFVDTVIVEITRDGVPQDFDTVFFINEYDDPAVAFRVLIQPGRAKVPQDWLMTWEFTEEHDDGLGSVVPAGEFWEMPRTIVWTPRGQFPSGLYDPSDF